MITPEFVILFLSFSIPLVCTPGPGNLILAMSGARWGVRQTIPLIVGIDITYIICSLLIGLGLGEIFNAWPLAYTLLKYAGGGYLVYLARKIWMLRAKTGDSAPSAMGLKDGVILTLLNPKAHVLMILMFSQFMTPGSHVFSQVVILTLALALVNIPNHFAWGYMGEMAVRRMAAGKNERTVNGIFALMLIGVAVYILAG
ncbi:MAG: LysE family translocator [Desulfobacterales bacterium]|nr:LysE family translocator [Desulfobacterales bacterium]